MSYGAHNWVYNMKKSFKKYIIKLLPVFMVAALLIGAFGVYLLGNSRQLASFDTTTQRYEQLTRLSKTVLSKGTGESKLSVRVDAIEQLAKLNRNNQCSGDWWNDWQQTLPRIKDKLGVCRKYEAKISTLAALAMTTSRHINDDAELANQINKLRIDTNAKNWQQTAVKNAQSALAAIDGSKPIKPVEPVKKAASERVLAITKAWQALTVGSAKQDKTIYLNAKADLEQAYASLDLITDVSDKQLEGAMTPLIEAAAKI